MADVATYRSARATRLKVRTILGSTALLVVISSQQTQAQDRVVSACSGVSLPRSVVTDIISPVVTGITGPTEATVNGILNAPLLGVLLPPLNLDATNLLNQAAAGDPITLQVLANDGTVVGPTDQCRVTADSITLDAPAGVAIGGNQITGLGASGAAAFASDIDAIAFGNNARAEAGATASMALGSGSSVTVANSVALGAGSTANRGALTGYVAPGLSGAQASAGEVSIGAPGALRQLTNVAAGSAPTDAATVGQVSGVLAEVAALDASAVQYDGAARDRVTLAGTGGTTIGNLAPGAVTVGSAEAVNGSQLFATNQALGTNTSAIASLDTRVTTNATTLAALDAAAVRYDGPDRAIVTFGGATGTILGNIAPGALTADSRQAVNGSQLFATNAQVAANTAAIAGLQSGGGSPGPVRYSEADTPSVPNGGSVTNNVTLVGASGGPVGLNNVAGGALSADSTAAVNGGQLFATNQTVTGNTTAITNLDARVTTTEGQVTNLSTTVAGNSTAITNLTDAVANQPIRYADAGTPAVPNGGIVTDEATLAGASGGPVALHNVRGGVVAAGSTDAINGDQLAATNAQVAANTSAITNLNTLVAGSTVSPVQYSDPGTPTVPNGGTRTNSVTLAGADASSPVAIHNVAGGTIAAGSTDAVNGGQLHAVATTASNSVQYEQTAAGVRTNTVRLAGGNAAAAVTVANVAAGRVAADSTDAVNGSQLQATNQVAQQAATLAANSVQYDGTGTSVSLAGRSGTAVTLRNVAAGTAPADAVNVSQLQSGLQSAVAQAGAYTDGRIGSALAAVNFDIGQARRDMSASTSGALAAAALPQATEPGRTMIAVGGGTYRNQSAVAFGASTFLNDGHSILRLGATVDSRGYAGANAGFGYQF